MRLNKVKYNISAGPYCMMHDLKVPFFIPAYSSSKRIVHCFHADIKSGESGVSYDMIIVRDMMVKIGLLDEFTC